MSLNLNTSLNSIQTNLDAQAATVNRSLTTLVSDFSGFADVIRDNLSRPPDSLAAVNLPRIPRSRLTVTLNDLQRLGAEFRRELNNFGALERSAWKRLVDDRLTLGFYQRLRSDLPGLTTHQLRQLLVENDTPSSDRPRNHRLDDDSPGGADVEQLTGGTESRHALLNADVPTMDLSVVEDRVTRELTQSADALDVDVAVKVKVLN